MPSILSHLASREVAAPKWLLQPHMGTATATRVEGAICLLPPGKGTVSSVGLLLFVPAILLAQTERVLYWQVDQMTGIFLLFFQAGLPRVQDWALIPMNKAI